MVCAGALPAPFAVCAVLHGNLPSVGCTHATNAAPRVPCVFGYSRKWIAAISKKLRRRYAALSEQQTSGSASGAPAFSYSMGDTHNTRKPILSIRLTGSLRKRAAERA